MAAKKSAEPSSLGGRIKKIRLEKGWSLAQLAGETGVAEKELERVEEGAVMPAVGTLLLISRALEVDSDNFLKEEKEARKTRAEAFEKRTENYAYCTLSPGARHKHLKAFRITIEPNSAHQSVGYRHEGEEFVYVLSGKLSITVGEQTTILGPDESLHFNSLIPHKLANNSDKQTKAVVVLYTP